MQANASTITPAVTMSFLSAFNRLTPCHSFAVLKNAPYFAFIARLLLLAITYSPPKKIASNRDLSTIERITAKQAIKRRQKIHSNAIRFSQFCIKYIFCVPFSYSLTFLFFLEVPFYYDFFNFPYFSRPAPPQVEIMDGEKGCQHLSPPKK